MKFFGLFRKLFHLNWLLFFLMLACAVASIFFIYSATFNADLPELRGAAKSQIMWLVIGLGVFFALAIIDYEHLINFGPLIYGGSVLLLLVVLIFGTEVNNARSWLPLGPFRLQPAEFSKLAYICVLSWLLVIMQDTIKRLPVVVFAVLLTLLPMGLILLQPDFGSAMVFGPILLFGIFVSGARRRYVVLPLAVASAGIVMAFFVIHKAEWKGTLQDLPRCVWDGAQIAIMVKKVPGEGSDHSKTLAKESSSKDVIRLMKPYQVDRIRTFFDPDIEPLGAGWTIRQSKIAIGSGGMRGKGWCKGDQNLYGFLPKDIAYNDFIFAVIGEEWGFIGGTVLVIFLGAIILIIVHIAARSKDVGGAIFAGSFAGMLFAHYFVNIGMTIQMAPITGIPLPLTSYGGSFLITCMAGLGIMQSIWIHRREFQQQQQQQEGRFM